MSSLSLPQRFVRGNSSTPSLDSGETSAKKSPARARSWNLEAKPLPPTPTRPGIPSSKFNVYVEELLLPTPNIVSLEDIQQPLQAYQQSKIFSSSTSNLPDKLPCRPELKREAKTEVFSNSVKERKPDDESRFSEWRAPKYESSDDEVGPDSPPLGKSLDRYTQESSHQKHAAEQHAAEYMSVLHACDALLPSFDAGSYAETYEDIPPSISGSVCDAVNGYLAPHALRLSLDEESQPSSYFSSDSETSDYKEGKKTFRSRAKRVFHSRKPSHEKEEKAWFGSGPSKTLKTVSLSPSERAAIQESIIDMYEALHSLSEPSAKPDYQVASPIPESKIIAKEIQSPASPTKIEQQLEQKESETAEATSPCSSKSTRSTCITQWSGKRSSKDSYSTLSSVEGERIDKSINLEKTNRRWTGSRSLRRKLAKAWEVIALSRGKGTRKAIEMKRDTLKKSIVLVGIADPV